MQRLLICCCLLAATLRGMEASTQDNRDHEMVRVREDDDQDGHNDVQPSAVDMRIVGGRQITIARLGGYIVALRFENRFVCGGTLIHEKIVLSAAHCFVGRMEKEKWTIVGGIYRLHQRGELRSVENFVISPKFRMMTMNWDVAVIMLNEPMIGKNIRPVSLCSTKLQVGMEVDVSGWGKANYNDVMHPIILRSIKVPIIDWENCQQAYRLERRELTETMICASILGRKDACTYDSGGPLVYNKEVCGIVSFGVECAHKIFPGVYTDVYAIKSYIKQTMDTMLSMN